MKTFERIIYWVCEAIFMVGGLIFIGFTEYFKGDIQIVIGLLTLAAITILVGVHYVNEDIKEFMKD